MERDREGIWTDSRATVTDSLPTSINSHNNRYERADGRSNTIKQ
jgi:hypothetical protein